MSHSLQYGDCREVLKVMPAESAHCIVTSPPYWGLRSYGDSTIFVWGGLGNCQHDWRTVYGGMGAGHKNKREGALQDKQSLKRRQTYSQTCSVCGAWKGGLGLEPIPDCLAWARGRPLCGQCYVCHLVEIFREVRRVLRSDGTCWIVIGDSYAGSNCGSHDYRSGGASLSKSDEKYCGQRPGRVPGLKGKNLCGIPWRVGLALQADGWYLRQDIIWAKRNCLPESVRDRCTKAHEYVFLFAKSPRYYFDGEAIKEPISATYATDKRPHGILRQRFYRNSKYVKEGMMALCAGEFPKEEREEKRNKRSVWTVRCEPLKEPHFAAFPRALIEPMILAGTSQCGCCPHCGAPYERILKKGFMSHDAPSATAYPDGSNAKRLSLLRQAARQEGHEYANESRTVGWRQGCKCPTAPPIPAIVLDPFMDSGTTGLVCQTLGRDFIGIEANPEYLAIAKRRLAVNEQLPGF
jgi:DNA modification methylase